MLGTYPEISLECAKSRQQYARNLLAQGINPCEMKATLGKNAFILRIREWEITQKSGRSNLVNSIETAHPAASALEQSR
jgi:hypothetical protein